MKRKVNAIWKGDGADGKGFLTAQSGAFNKMTYSFKTRFENDEGKLGTNPEELNTDAVLTFVDGKIISIELNLSAKVPGVSKEEFKELAEDAKKNCPISGALNCDIILNPSLI